MAEDLDVFGRSRQARAEVLDMVEQHEFIISDAGMWNRNDGMRPFTALRVIAVRSPKLHPTP